MPTLPSFGRCAALSLAAATGLMAGPFGHATGNAATQGAARTSGLQANPADEAARINAGIQSRIAADTQAAWDDLAVSLAAAGRNGAVTQLRQVRDQLSAYQWRTVYEIVQVSKSPMPGTRLGLQALPVMGQWEAESYLNTLPSVQKMGGIPGLNCPVTGGSAGRSITVTAPGGSGAVVLSDPQIHAAMLSASPAQGEAAFQAYLSLKTSTCTAIYTVAQLSFRTKKLQDLQASWDECATNGVQLSGWSVSERFGFSGGIHRTVQAGGGVLFKCGAVYKGDGEDALTYDSWFKFSDDSPVPLNLPQQLKNTGSSPNACPKACVPVVGGGSLSANLCIGLDPGIAAVGDTVPLRLGASIHYRAEDKALCSPVINVPAPFGVAQSLGEMADNHKRQLTSDLQNQLLAVLPISSDTIAKVRQLRQTVH